jgi:uncharacterized membrane protein
MDKLLLIGRIFFAIAFLGLGVEHFVFQEFVTGRAPAWPESLPGRTAWAYVSGITIAACAAAILFGRMARTAAMVLAVLIFAWALLRHIPVVAMSELLSADWTRAVKALAFTGGALAVAATWPQQLATRQTRIVRMLNHDYGFIVAARVCLAVFMTVCGVQHFLYTEFVASLIPQWFPGDPVFWTYFAAAALFAGALGLLYPRTARLAALLTGVMIFSWFWIVHVPRVSVSVSDKISVFEALAMAGIAFILAGYRRRETAAPPEGLPRPFRWRSVS